MAENLNVSSAPKAAPAQTAAAPAQAAQAAPQAPQAGGTTPAGQNAAPKAPQAPQSSKKKYNLKIDGREEAIEFDPANEEEVRKHLQMSRVAQKRMQQFSEYENNVKDLFELLKNDPIKVLSDPRLGIDEATRRKMAEMIINNEIEELQKTPEQREKERMQREYETLKKQHEEEKAAREQAEQTRLTQQYAQQLDVEITDAIEKSGLPKTARTVKYFAEALMFCVQNNIDLSPKDLAPLIKKQTLGDFREIIGSLPDDSLEDFIGKDTASRLRKRSIARIKQVAPAADQVKDTGAADRKPAEPAKRVSAKDFFRGLGGNTRTK